MVIRVNDEGKQRAQYVKRESLKMLIIGPLISFSLLYYLYLRMSKWVFFFNATSPILIIIMFIGFIYAPILMLKRHNHTINEIAIENDLIKIKVFSALWMKSKQLEINKNDIRVINSKFRWYGKGVEKLGLTLKTSDNKELYFVFDYFDEPENFKKTIIS